MAPSLGMLPAVVVLEPEALDVVVRVNDHLVVGVGMVTFLCQIVPLAVLFLFLPTFSLGLLLLVDMCLGPRRAMCPVHLLGPFLAAAHVIVGFPI